MSRVRLPYVHEYRDRHNRLRRYFRRPGMPSVALPGRPGSPEFMEAYREAVEQFAKGKPSAGASRTKPGSIDVLAVSYYGSPAYLALRDSTKATYRGEVEWLRREHGDKRAFKIERQHVDRIIAAKLASGGVDAANNRLRVLRLLMKHAVELGWRTDDPTLGVRKIRSGSDGFHSWTESEIAAFEACWPIGTRERLAFGLLLYAAQRRGDIVTMGRQHISDGAIDVRQSKTGKHLRIPLHPELLTILDAAPNGNMTLLVTAYGKPFTPAGFGGWFRKACDAAGLRGCSAHGLRKAAARRLAEAGCTEHEFTAMTGHDSLQEVQRYTKAAEQERLAQAAMAALNRTTSEQKMANLADGSKKRLLSL